MFISLQPLLKASFQRVFSKINNPAVRDELINYKGLPSAIPHWDTQQSQNKPFRVMFISLQPLLKASFQRVFSKINNPAVRGVCSVFAERGGFEPPVQFPIRQFSKLLV
jgi:hypothetical protein